MIDTSRFLPPSRDIDFVHLVCDAFNLTYGHGAFAVHGRSGQGDQAVDIEGVAPHTRGIGVQCKCVRHLSTTLIDTELKNARAYLPPLREYIIATATPRDARVSAHLRSIAPSREQDGAFPVRVYHWEDILQLVQRDDATVRRWFGAYFLPDPDHAVSDLDRRTYEAFVGELPAEVVRRYAIHDFREPFQLLLVDRLHDFDERWQGDPTRRFQSPALAAALAHVLAATHAFSRALARNGVPMTTGDQSIQTRYTVRSSYASPPTDHERDRIDEVRNAAIALSEAYDMFVAARLRAG